MSNAVPTRLESEGLAAALQSALDHDFRDSFDRVEWHADPAAVERAKQLPLFASEVIFFAAQEAIRNAAKHGRGGDAQRPLHLDVALQNGSSLKIIIGDDGVGREIDPAEGEVGQRPALSRRDAGRHRRHVERGRSIGRRHAGGDSGRAAHRMPINPINKYPL